MTLDRALEQAAKFANEHQVPAQEALQIILLLEIGEALRGIELSLDYASGQE